MGSKGKGARSSRILLKGRRNLRTRIKESFTNGEKR
jgi:hypothetical protein